MMLLAALNWHSIAFLFFALVACGFAVAVVLTSNIVRMAFYLTLSLGAVSGLFFLAGAEFVGAMQLLIYVGGTLVALVHLGPFANIEPGPGAIAFGAVVVLTMLATMSFDPRLIWDPLDQRHD